MRALVGKPMELVVEAVGSSAESWPPLESQALPPDLGHPVLGYRAWRLDRDGLRSVAAQARWRERTLVAGCAAGGDGSGHAAPAARCRCGIYALHEPPLAVFDDELVWGAVAVDGRVLLYKKGLRAERATILVLAHADAGPRPDLVRAARALDVELVPFAALIAAAGACGAEPAPDAQAFGNGRRPGDGDAAWDAVSPPTGPRPLAAAVALPDSR